MSMATEVVNIFLLTTYTSVDKCIINFVTLGVVLDLSKFYYKALGDNSLKFVFDKPIKKTNKGAEIKISDRSCFHVFFRILYKFTRALYISTIFYFVPYYYYAYRFLKYWPYQ